MSMMTSLEACTQGFHKRFSGRFAFTPSEIENVRSAGVCRIRDTPPADQQMW